MARDIPESQTQLFLMNLVKLIPAELVAVYLILQSMVPATLVGYAFISIPLFLIVPFYLIFAMKIKRIDQIVLMTVAFAVWVFALGGPFIFFVWYEAWMAGVVLTLFTLLPPMVYGYRAEIPTESTASFSRKQKLLQMMRGKSWREI